MRDGPAAHLQVEVLASLENYGQEDHRTQKNRTQKNDDGWNQKKMDCRNNSLLNNGNGTSTQHQKSGTVHNASTKCGMMQCLRPQVLIVVMTSSKGSPHWPIS